MGLIHLRQSDFESAAAEFRSELELRPADPVTRYHLGYTLLMQGHAEQAVALLRQVVLAKTESRTVLGYMNEMARFCEYGLTQVRRGVGLSLPLHLTANDSQLVAKKQQLRLRIANPHAHVGDVEEKAQERVHKREQHPEAMLAASYRHSG